MRKRTKLIIYVREEKEGKKCGGKSHILHFKQKTLLLTKI